MLSETVQSPNRESIQGCERFVIDREKQVRKSVFIINDRLLKIYNIVKERIELEIYNYLKRRNYKNHCVSYFELCLLLEYMFYSSHKIEPR